MDTFSTIPSERKFSFTIRRRCCQQENDKQGQNYESKIIHLWNKKVSMWKLAKVQFHFFAQSFLSLIWDEYYINYIFNRRSIEWFLGSVSQPKLPLDPYFSIFFLPETRNGGASKSILIFSLPHGQFYPTFNKKSYKIKFLCLLHIAIALFPIFWTISIKYSVTTRLKSATTRQFKGVHIGHKS